MRYTEQIRVNKKYLIVSYFTSHLFFTPPLIGLLKGEEKMNNEQYEKLGMAAVGGIVGIIGLGVFVILLVLLLLAIF